MDQANSNEQFHKGNSEKSTFSEPRESFLLHQALFCFLYVELIQLVVHGLHAAQGDFEHGPTHIHKLSQNFTKIVHGRFLFPAHQLSLV